MAWQPDEAAVAQVIEILQHAQTPDTQVQVQVQAQLEQYAGAPGFNQTLGFIFVARPDQQLCTRLQAGLLLKNNVRRAGGQLVSWPPALLEALEGQVRWLLAKRGACVAARRSERAPAELSFGRLCGGRCA